MKAAALALALLWFAGCNAPDVDVYEILKEAGGPAAVAVAPQERPAGTELSWKAPARWKAAPATGMRLASFSFAGADISVVAIPGAAGGDLANVNRWRGQLGLSPLDEKGLRAQAAAVKSKAGEMVFVDFTGVDAKGEIRGKARLLGAILPLGEKQWFFKAMGEEKAVAQAKPSFMEFLRSVRRAPNS